MVVVVVVGEVMGRDRESCACKVPWRECDQHTTVEINISLSLLFSVCSQTDADELPP